ncbi:MAG: putative DNA modification/repair radical SAM protein [Firmicutes bacterium]|nr:putative DNA modification/repair radical SAM protein [Bacillota bacterium]
METLAKLQVLGEGAKYDICSSTSGPQGSGVCQSFTPDGRCISLLRVLMSNNCERDCAYCPNRVQRDVPRTTFAPEELARLFMDFYRRNYVSGLFLSSGIDDNADKTMDKMLATAELLRSQHGFTGYIHLKLIPGCSAGHIQEAVRLAQRVSINCETPDQESLARLSRAKSWEDITGAMEMVRTLTAADRGRQSTQFIVGAAQETDLAILKRALDCYRRYNMLRVYFSAFVPVPDTPLAVLDRTSLVREQRLYQSDFLLRQYGFRVEELPFVDGQLPLDQDPKLAWARANPGFFPLEVNRATRKELLRVPGIGPVSAGRIIKVRRQGTIANLNELKNIGVVTSRAAPYLLIRGKLAMPNRAQFNFQQLSLFGGD